MPLKIFSEEKNLIAFMGDGACDFTPQDFDSPLSQHQQDYLKKETGYAIPQVFWRKQIHGDDILIAKGSAQGAKSCPDADAYMTQDKNLPIAIRTADCVPVFLFDPLKQVIALVHAGWKGTHQQITAKTVKRMQAIYNSNLADLKAYLGPSILPCCYQVGEEFCTYFPSRIEKRNGFLYADVEGANYDQLKEAGLNPGHIERSKICTFCNKNYFSFRRDDQKAGRMISVMMLL